MAFADLVLPGHDLSRTLRRDFAARPADLRAGCAGGCDPPSDPAARSRRATVAGRAGRSRVAAAIPGVHASTTARASSPTIAISSCASSGRPASASSADGAARAATSRWSARRIRTSGKRTRSTTRIFAYHLPDALKWHRYANRDYLEFAQDVGFIGAAEPIVMQIWSEPLAEVPVGGTGSLRGPQARTTRRIASDWRRISIRCRSGTRRSRPTRPMARRFRCRR